MKFLQATRRHIFAAFVSLFAGLVLVGCGTLTGPLPTEGEPAGTQPRNASPTTSEDINRFQVGELVKVDFSGPIQQTPPPVEEHIKDDGTINLHLVGKMQAAGKTPGQLQKDIETAYQRYFKNLTVRVKGADLFYFVGGQVKRPDRQLYLGPITVIGAIKSAGDFTEFANRKKVKLVRANGSIYTIDINKAEKNPDLDLPVYPGDKIEVPQRWY